MGTRGGRKEGGVRITEAWYGLMTYLLLVFEIIDRAQGEIIGREKCR